MSTLESAEPQQPSVVSRVQDRSGGACPLFDRQHCYYGRPSRSARHRTVSGRRLVADSSHLAPRETPRGRYAVTTRRPAYPSQTRWVDLHPVSSADKAVEHLNGSRSSRITRYLSEARPAPRAPLSSGRTLAGVDLGLGDQATTPPSLPDRRYGEQRRSTCHSFGTARPPQRCTRAISLDRGYLSKVGWLGSADSCVHVVSRGRRR